MFEQTTFSSNWGTAICAIVAPIYVTVVMGYFEIQFCENCKNEFCINNGKYIEENCHIDDRYIALDVINIILIYL